MVPLDAGSYRAGMVALAAGVPADALPLLEQAAIQGDRAPYAWLNMGLALSQLGRLTDAVLPLERAAAALPDLAEPWMHLGQVTGLLGQAERAETCFHEALARDPSHVPAIAGLAAMAEQRGSLAEAASLLQRARRIDPAEPELSAWIARVALLSGDAETARHEAASLLEQRPTHSEAARILTRALHRLHPPKAALAWIEARAAAAPLSPAWALARSAMLGMLGDLDGTIAELQLAAILAPDQPEVQAELGAALLSAGRGAEAETALRAAVAARPLDSALRSKLATALWKSQRLGEAVALIEESLRAFGPDTNLLGSHGTLANLAGRQDDAVASTEQMVAISGGSRSALTCRLYTLAYHPRGDAAALLEAARAIDQRAGPETPPLHACSPDPDRTLRVGLLSGNFGRHPVGWLTLGGLEALPEPGFKLVAYSLKRRQDSLNARYRARCETWREVGTADEPALAQIIAGDGIDILIDLAGFGDGGRPFTLTRRPAPVQIKWVGSQFATMGLSCIDWMLTDRWETPEGFERFYTERLLRLPDGYVCYTPPGYAADVAPLPALANGHVTFGCFNNLAKITPVVMAAWDRILRALPDARLVLRTQTLSEASLREGMQARMEAAGLPMDRVALCAGLPHERFLASYGEIDIALDPFPYTGGLTVCEALWMGVPTVTLAGTSFAGRHALSHLSNVGLGDWASDSIDGYVAMALARAQDLPGLAALRAGLRAQVRASPLCDAERFGRGLAGALRFAWHDWCARQPAQARAA